MSMLRISIASEEIIASNAFVDIKKLKLINKNFWSYLRDTKQVFSLISTGNLTDLLTVDQLKENLKLIYQRLKPDGRVIFRRMFHNIPLFEYVNKHFMILNIERDFLTDETYLYQEIILATPKHIR